MAYSEMLFHYGRFARLIHSFGKKKNTADLRLSFLRALPIFTSFVLVSAREKWPHQFSIWEGVAKRYKVRNQLLIFQFFIWSIIISR